MRGAAMTRPGCWAVLLLAAMAGGHAGAAEPAAEALALASCVDGSPPLAFARADRRALLDDADRERFQHAALTRYRVVGPHVLATAQILLWGKGADEWIYVTVRTLDDAGGGPSCFTATFSGDAFEFTPDLVRKYFPGAGRS